MIYPSEHDIIEYFANLPQAATDEFAELLERGQRDYRRAWQLGRLNEDKRIDVLSQFAADVFKTRVAKILRERAGNFEGFRAAIGIEGGAAELAFWYAHRLYNLVERDQMLAIWHHKIAQRLGDRIREAETLWYTPDLVPDGWETFLGPATATNAPTSLPGTSREKELHGLVTPRTTTGTEPDDFCGSGDANGNRAVVDEFIRQCLRATGVKVTRTMIWRGAGYRDRTEFERWQASHPKATPTAGQNFGRLLAMSNEDFVALLREQQIIS